MEQITINTTTQLLEFIKRKDVKKQDAKRVIKKALNVLILADYTKEQLISETEYYIENFSNNNSKERPLVFTMYLPDIGNRK
ncbi:hypothetical protein MC378_07340 [Polaribacter sp. MSW13]|uniref:Uncharacterized protein n=1 Tax=Polaribacter marinus TaxID=2916838 RepID=A0A9X1VT98_9FLAO|nr:hypothetical protein [Polaribacter marinus]MCI2228976.1 hypothetical protein [Polaribacter marinus]